MDYSRDYLGKEKTTISHIDYKVLVTRELKILKVN